MELKTWAMNFGVGSFGAKRPEIEYSVLQAMERYVVDAGGTLTRRQYEWYKYKHPIMFPPEKEKSSSIYGGNLYRRKLRIRK